MNAPIVVSNTSPIIFLEKISSLSLLENCFQKICIPEAVLREWGVNSLPSFFKLSPISPSGKSYVEGAMGRLHRGELEAIQLAVEMKTRIVLMDDLLARKFAKRKELLPLGTLGIIKLAYQMNYIDFDEVQSKVNSLIQFHGLFVDQKVLKNYWSSFSSTAD